MLKFRCPECDQKIGVPEEWADHNVRCPRCRKAILVPRMIEAVVQTAAAAPAPPKPAAPAAPKAPLTPMPSPRGKTVGVPHPAVKRKAPAAKPVVIPPAKPQGGPAVQKKPPEPAHPKRDKAPVARSVEPAPQSPASVDPEARFEPAPAGPDATGAEHPSKPDAPPEPVVVSAVRAPSKSIVTEIPLDKDFSSLFSDASPAGVGSSDFSPPEKTDGAGGAGVTDAPASGPPLSEVMDVLGGPDEPGVTSSTTVSDIVKGLTREPAQLPPPSPAPAAPRPAPRAPEPFIRRVEPPVRNTSARAIGALAMLLGVGGLALCVTPRMTRFALPVGVGGLILAVIGAAVPARRRGTEIALAFGSSAISIAGVALSILVAAGIVPSPATGRPLRDPAPTARLGDVEVRVTSVAVVQPVLYAEGKSAPTVDPHSRLRIGIEVHNLAQNGTVAYKSWGAARPDLEPVLLVDDEGNQLKLNDPAPALPPGRPREFPASVPAHSRGVADVLLFEVPPAGIHELFLQLPGSNVQAGGGFNIQIPASMLRKQ